MENKKIYELELLKKKSKNFFRITIPINTNKKDNQFKTRGFLEALPRPAYILLFFRHSKK